MRYLIDGYNLLHAMGLLHGRVGPHSLERARLALLAHLCGVHRTEASAVTVVFDAAGARPGAAPEDEYQGMHICYALNSTADDLIEDMIQRETAPGQLTVVSDDHRIQQAGHRRRCLVFGCMEYLDHMEEVRRPTAPSSEAPSKPAAISGDETHHWLREFADLADDPKLREALGPDFRDD